MGPSRAGTGVPAPYTTQLLDRRKPAVMYGRLPRCNWCRAGNPPVYVTLFLRAKVFERLGPAPKEGGVRGRALHGRYASTRTTYFRARRRKIPPAPVLPEVLVHLVSLQVQ